MTLRTTALTAACSLLLASIGVAEHQPESHHARTKGTMAKPAAADPQAGMEAMVKAATPGEQHHALESIVGTFDAKVSMWMAPNTPPQVSSGTSTNAWVLGNRYVEQKYEGTFAGQPFDGIGYAGYDNVLKQYVGTWMDNMGTGIMTSKGHADAPGVIVSKATMSDPMTGRSSSMREKLTIKDADTHVMEMWDPGPNGKEVKIMEITYTRKK